MSKCIVVLQKASIGLCQAFIVQPTDSQFHNKLVTCTTDGVEPTITWLNTNTFQGLTMSWNVNYNKPTTSSYSNVQIGVCQTGYKISFPGTQCKINTMYPNLCLGFQ